MASYILRKFSGKKSKKKRAPGERKESVNALRANDKVILYLC